MVEEPTYDVAVIGAGIAGLAACILLRQAGLDVVCLDAHAYPHHKVGESLDWSSPGLLARLNMLRKFSLFFGGRLFDTYKGMATPADG